MESQRLNCNESERWFLPTISKDRSEAVLEIRDFISINENENEEGFIGVRVFFTSRSDPPPISEGMNSKCVFTLPSETSQVKVVIDRYPGDPEADGHGGSQLELMYRRSDNASITLPRVVETYNNIIVEHTDDSNMTLMQRFKSSREIQPSSNLNHKLMEPSKAMLLDLETQQQAPAWEIEPSSSSKHNSMEKALVHDDEEMMVVQAAGKIMDPEMPPAPSALDIEMQREKLSMDISVLSSAALDIEMQREKLSMDISVLSSDMASNIKMPQQTPLAKIEPSSSLKHNLMEHGHEPTKNLNLLKAAYHSMNSNSRNFIIPNWVLRETGFHQNAIYKQRTLIGNTVLHLAASYGNNEIVQKIAQDAPELFTSVNSNYDTALHVAARAGHGSTIQLLLNSFFHFVRHETTGRDHQSILEMMLMVSLTLFRNKQGNTFFHEAFITDGHNGDMIFQAFEVPFITGSLKFEANFKEIVNHLALFAVNEEEKSLLYLAIEVGCKQVVDRLMDICIQCDLKPQGKPPILSAINKRSIDMLATILSKKSNWMHLRDEEGRLPLHLAASMDSRDVVSYLIKKCASCTMESDNHGFLPIHLACSGGHVEVAQKLLKCYPNPIEMLNNKGRNPLHLASRSGKYEVVRYILQHHKLEGMINQKDNNGDTPLHLATRCWHPKIVHALTWDNRVNLALVNKQNQTALDIANLNHDRNPSLAQRLTWAALKSAGTPRNSPRLHSKGQKVGLKEEAANTKQYKDRVDTLIVVSTLIITASFAAGFTIPGDVDQGVPLMLNHCMFQLFILSLTIAFYFAISATIILMWARLEDPHLALFALKCAKPLLGFSLATLSIAYVGGVYLLLGKLSWLATTFLVIGVVLTLKVVLLYTLLWLPSSSTSTLVRYISYYPFLFFAMIAEG